MQKFSLFGKKLVSVKARDAVLAIFSSMWRWFLKCYLALFWYDLRCTD